MNAEIICIGTEILLGQILNTNQQWLSLRLSELGIDVYHQSTVGDNPQRLAQAIRQGLDRSDIVITTGGLGPTVDDITLEVISDVLSKEPIYNKKIADQIKSHFRSQRLKMPRENLRQAFIPEGAKILENSVGTAPGFIIDENGKILIALPGPPRELNPMFESYAMPYLRKRVKGEGSRVIRIRTLKITGLPESAVDKKIKDLLNSPPPVTVGIYAKPALIELKVMASARNEKAANTLIDRVDRKIYVRLKDYIFGRDDETLEGVVGKTLLRLRKTLAIAESCTGGLISDRITDIPGSSMYFTMGIVAYSNESKISKLGVRAETLLKYGAVSRQAAVEMARNIRRVAGSDIGLSVTGIAGPGGSTRTKPVGLVYIAVALPNKIICREFHFRGERETIKFRSSQAALDLLRRFL